MSIPRRIISCWFGRGEKSDLYKRCREAKQKVFQGWEFLDVNEDNCEIMDAPYMRAAVAANAPVRLTAARLWALRKFGGWYMDEDVEPLPRDGFTLKEFERLGDSKDFVIGYESDRYFCDGIIGSAAMCEAASRLFWSFPWGDEEQKPLIEYGPPRTTNIVNSFPAHVMERCALLEREVLYPWQYGQEPRFNAPDKTLTIHHWSASWLTEKT